MIRPLRRAHGWTISAVIVLLVALAWLIIANPPPARRMDRLPAAVVEQP